MDRVAEKKEHIQKAKNGVKLAKKLIQSGEYSVVVLDELVDTLQEVMQYLPYSLLKVKEVQQLLKLAAISSTHVVVTGRRVTPEWQPYIKNAIGIAEIKHPWSTRKAGAVSGLDF